MASQRKRVRRTPRGGVLTEKDTQIHPHARAALGSPMASVVFTRGHLGTTHAADRLRARESTAACMQGRTRVVMGRPRARIRAHARTARGTGRGASQVAEGRGDRRTPARIELVS